MSEGTLAQVLAVPGGFAKGFDPRRGSTRTHGMSKTPTHRAWCGMIDRCENPNNKKWSRYGGRGIRICERWRHSFENFLSDMGAKPPNTSLDRINNDGNYEPSNCRWATVSQQARNNSLVRPLTHGGHTASVAEWAERTGLSGSTIRRRLGLGWSVSDALTRPLRGSR